MPDYAVLLSGPQSHDPRAIAQLVAAASGRTAIDAMQQLYHGRGLLAVQLTAEQAQELGRQLTAMGLRAFAVPESRLLPHVRPHAATTGRLREEGFELEDQLNRVQLEPWDQLSLVAAACVETDQRELSPLERAHQSPERDGPAKVGDEEDGLKREYYLDLCFSGDSPRHYRIEAGSFSYHYLAEDGRLSLRRDDNFVTFVNDVLRHAQHAWVTPAVTALGRGELLSEAVVRDVKLFDAELRWRLMVLRCLGRPSPPGSRDGNGAAGVV